MSLLNDLETTFKNACAIFNKDTDKTIGDLLSPNIIVYSVTDQDIYVGIQEAENFFAADYADHPQFDPYTNFTPKYSVTADNKTGVITGKANWRDDNGKEVLKYSFVFTYDSAAPNNWRILSLYSKTISG
jgi:hypothetical protein